jgi:hypothetical protein
VILLVAAGLLVQVGGVSIYFNSYYAVAGKNLPAAQLQMGPYYFHNFHFVPGMSPIIGHARLLRGRVAGFLACVREPGLVATGQLLPETTAWIHYAREERPYRDVYRVPDRITPFYSWFFLPTLDFTWCYWWYSGLPRAWVLLWLLPLLPALIAGRRLWRLRHD